MSGPRMQFRIADTFTDSLGRLTGDEQKAVKTTAWQLTSSEAYRDVARLGRKTRLPEKQRQVLWAIFQRVRAELNRTGLPR